MLPALPRLTFEQQVSQHIQQLQRRPLEAAGGDDLLLRFQSFRCVTPQTFQHAFLVGPLLLRLADSQVLQQP